MRLKLLHTSDWHLGHPFRAFQDDVAVTLRRQRLSTVEHILRVAGSHQVDAVLCAGDLFDSPNPDEECWRSLAELLASMPHPCPVFLLPGTQDPLGPDSVYDASHPFRAALPDWVQVVDTAGFEAELAPGAVLVAQPAVADAQSLPSRAAGDTRIRVGMAHAAGEFDADAGASAGLDYLALGGSHNLRELHPASGAGVGLTVQAGAPEPLGFGEETASVVLAQLRPHGRAPRYRRQRVGHFRWEHVACTELSQMRDLVARTDLQRTVLRLTLELAVTLEEKEELGRLLLALTGSDVESGRVGVIERIDRSGERIAADAFATQLPDHVPQVMHEVHARLRARLADPEQRVATQTALLHLHKLIAGGAR